MLSQIRLKKLFGAGTMSSYVVASSPIWPQSWLGCLSDNAIQINNNTSFIDIRLKLLHLPLSVPQFKLCCLNDINLFAVSEKYSVGNILLNNRAKQRSSLFKMYVTGKFGTASNYWVQFACFGRRSAIMWLQSKILWFNCLFVWLMILESLTNDNNSTLTDGLLSLVILWDMKSLFKAIRMVRTKTGRTKDQLYEGCGIELTLSANFLGIAQPAILWSEMWGKHWHWELRYHEWSIKRYPISPYFLQQDLVG